MGKLTLQDLKVMKSAGEPITCATAYDYAGIHMIEDAEIDILIPHDWGIGTTLFGEMTAVMVTMEHVLFYLKGLAQSVKRGFIITPMPFGSYEVSNEEAIRNGSRLIKEHADSVLLEGGGPTMDRIAAVTEVGIPCMAYLGYLPQQVKKLGPECVVGDNAKKAVEIYRDSLLLQEAGAWGLILHNVPEKVAQVIAEKTNLITISAGGTRGCDGHLIFTHDLLGWPQRIRPLFSVQYASFYERAVSALNQHCEEVQRLQFPTEKHTFTISDEDYEIFIEEIKKGD